MRVLFHSKAASSSEKADNNFFFKNEKYCYFQWNGKTKGRRARARRKLIQSIRIHMHAKKKLRQTLAARMKQSTIAHSLNGSTQ